MALNKLQQEGLDMLDLSKGGGFINFTSNQNRLETQEHKFLFVGLGGKGSATIARLKTEACRQFELEGGKKRPKNFEYLAIDTDMTHLDELARPKYGEIGLSNETGDNELCQLYDADAAKRLRVGNRRLISGNILEWMNPTMNQEIVGNGAGGIRQAGRYLLFGENAFMRVERALKAKLTNLHDQITKPDREMLIIYIFAGVGGGTGSGIIIDIPYIIREICEEKGWKHKISGYIYLADTYPESAPQQRLQYNSYAALKEIDYFMNIGNMDGSGKFKAKYSPEFEIDTCEKIFDICVLISGKTAGHGSVPRPDIFCQRVVVDNVINLVKKNNTTEGFLIDSFLDNSLIDIQNKISMLGEKVPRNANYQYNVIGLGAVNLPLEQIFSYMSYHICQIMQKVWNVHPSQKNVEELLSIMHMLPEEQTERMLSLSKVPMMSYAKGIGGRASKTDVQTDALYHTLKGYWMNINVSLYSAWDEVKNKVLEEIISSFFREYKSIFAGKGKGIFYLRELLASRVENGDAFNGILQRIKLDYVESVKQFRMSQKTRQTDLDREMREIKEKISSPLCVGPMLQNQIEKYRKCCVERLTSDNLLDLYDIVLKNIEDIIDFIEVRLSELQNYIDVFLQMKDVLDRNFYIVMNGSMPSVEYSTQLLDLSQRDNVTMKVKGYLDNTIAEKKPEALVIALQEKMLETQKQWMNTDEEFNPMEVFVSFIEEQFKEIPGMTIEKFIELAYGKDNFAKGMLDVCEKLENNARVIYSGNMNLPLSSLPIKKYIVAPDKALNVVEAVEGYAKSHGITVAKGNDLNNIYWYNWICGVPLFSFCDIKEYEKVYEDRINNSSAAGVHIYEGTEYDFRQLADLYVYDLWRETEPEYNIREKQIVNRVKYVTKQLLESQIIYMDSSGVFKGRYIQNLDEEKAVYAWCSKEYIQMDENKDEFGKVMGKGRLLQKMRENFRFTDTLVQIPNVYIKVNESTIYQFLRMNWMLFLKLEKFFCIFTECEKLITEFNREIVEQEKVVRNRSLFFQLARNGLMCEREEDIVLIGKDGVEDELLFFEDVNGIDAKFYLYTAFMRMHVSYQQEQLEQLEEYCMERGKDRDEEQREKRRQREEKFLGKCGEALDALKKTDTKRMFLREQKGELMEKMKDFYTHMLQLKTGRQ